MEKVQEAQSQSAPTPENQGIVINNVTYSYSITKSEGNEGYVFNL